MGWGILTTHFYVFQISCRWAFFYYWQISKWNAKTSRKSQTQYVAMVTKLLFKHWLKYPFFIFNQKLGSFCNVIILLICTFENLYLCNEKRYLKIVNSIFLPMQTTLYLLIFLNSLDRTDENAIITVLTFNLNSPML